MKKRPQFNDFVTLVNEKIELEKYNWITANVNYCLWLIEVAISHWTWKVNYERVLRGIADTYITYIHYFIYPQIYEWLIYATNISEHLTISWEIDHHTGNYVTFSFRTWRNSLWCEGSITLEQAHKAFCHSGMFCEIWKMQPLSVKKLFDTQACLHVLHVSVYIFLVL